MVASQNAPTATAVDLQVLAEDTQKKSVVWQMVAQLLLWLDDKNKTPQLRIPIQRQHCKQSQAVVLADVTWAQPQAAIGIQQAAQRVITVSIVADQSHTIVVAVCTLMQPHAVDTVWFTQVLRQEAVIHSRTQVLAVMLWPQAADQPVLGFGPTVVQVKTPQAHWILKVTITVQFPQAAAALVQSV